MGPWSLGARKVMVMYPVGGARAEGEGKGVGMLWEGSVLGLPSQEKRLEQCANRSGSQPPRWAHMNPTSWHSLSCIALSHTITGFACGTKQIRRTELLKKSLHFSWVKARSWFTHSGGSQLSWHEQPHGEAHRVRNWSSLPTAQWVSLDENHLTKVKSADRDKNLTTISWETLS